MNCGTTLEHRREFEGPWLLDHFPASMPLRQLERVFKVRAKVGAEIQAAIRDGLRRRDVQELGLYYPVFMMPCLRPRVGKQHENLSRSYIGWQGLKEQSSVGMDEVELAQARTLSLSSSATDPVAHDVYADAEISRMGLGVRREKMAMAAADFPSEALLVAEYLEQLVLKGAQALFDSCAMLDDASGVGFQIRGLTH
jgi:hypothetical protein